MLVHPTLDLLADLGLHGMSKAFQELEVQPETKALEHAALDHPAGHAGLTVGAIASTITIDPGAAAQVAGFKSERRPASSRNRWPGAVKLVACERIDRGHRSFRTLDQSAWVTPATSRQA